MPDKVKYENDDSLVETVGDVVAVTGAGAAATSYLFRGDNGRNILNNMLDAKYEFKYAKKYLMDNSSDITELSLSGFENALRAGRTQAAKFHDRGTGYLLSADPITAQLAESFKYGENVPSGLLRKEYNNLLAIEVEKAVAEAGITNKAVLEFFKNNIGYIPGSKLDKSALMLKAGRMTPLQIEQTDAVMDYVLSKANEWIKDNDFNDETASWRMSATTKVQKLKKLIYDPERLYHQQERIREGLTNTLSRKLIGDSVTVKELVTLYNQADENGKAELEKFFDNSGFFEYDKSAPGTPKKKSFLSKLAYEYGHAEDEAAEYFGKLRLTGVRIDRNGNLYNHGETVSMMTDLLSDVSKVEPIQMLRIDEFIYNSRNQNYTKMIKAGTRDINLAKSLGYSIDIVEDDVYRLGDEIWSYNKEAEAFERKRINITEMSTSIGMGKAQMTTSQGKGLVSNFVGRGFVSSLLGIDLGAFETPLETEKSIFNKLTTETADILDGAIDVYADYIKGSKSASESLEAINVINDFQKFINYSHDYARTLNGSTVDNLVNSLHGQTRYANALKFLELSQQLEKDGTAVLEDVLGQLMSAANPDGNYMTADLSKTVKAYRNNPKAEMSKLLTNKELANVNSRAAYHNISYIESIQRQLQNEFFLRLKTTGGMEIDEIFSLLEDNSKTISEAANSKSVAADTIIRELLKFNKYNPNERAEITHEGKKLTQLREMSAGFRQILTDTSEGGQVLKAQLANLISHVPEMMTESGESAGDILRQGPQSIITNKISSMDPVASWRGIIRDINNGHFEKAANDGLRSISSIGKVLIAGPNDVDYHSMISLPLNFLAGKLNEGLNRADETIEFLPFSPQKLGFKNFRLGLRPEDARNAGEILKNLTMKRALPFFAAYTAYEFVDDTFKSTTGTGLTEAGVAGATNVYLAAKKLTGITGIDSVLKNLSRDNVFFKYYSGDNNGEWNSYEEEKHYQEKGYSAIRRGRFWAFGSANEYRGSSIAYWELNTNRLLASDYRNESLYNGSFFTKWNPERLINPYYMENLHSEDRPYPVSGSLMDDSTPWGIAINSTIGDVIKPRIQLHSDRLINGVDTRTIIAHINNQIREKAQENNIVYLYQGRLRSMDFLSYNDSPENVEANIEERKAAGENLLSSTAKPYFGNPTVNGEYVGITPLSDNRQEYINNNLDRIASGKSVTLSASDKLAIESASGNILAKPLNIVAGSSLNRISEANSAIRNKAAKFDKTQGFMKEEKLRNYGEQIEKMYNSGDEIADLLNDSHADYLNQMAVSGRMLGGLYGYSITKMTGWGENNERRLATSQNMTSTSRRFWDSGIGGFGGEKMEIIRRFIPEYRRAATVNPLMNTMPDWLPERFRYGDPYCVSGETMIELNELNFELAQNIQIGDSIMTHKGNLKKVEASKIRDIEMGEKVYNLKITSLCAVDSLFSENHPILKCVKPEQRRLKPLSDTNLILYNQANAVINGLKNGITLKKELACLANTDTNNICRCFKLLYESGKIEDYKKNKLYITPKKLELYDIEMIRMSLIWEKAKNIKVGDYVAYPIPKYEEREIYIDLKECMTDRIYTNKYIYISTGLKNRMTAEIYEWMESNGYKKYNRGELKEILEKNKWNRDSFENVQAIFRNQKYIRRVSRFIKLTPELCYSLGVYLAEGYLRNQAGIELAVHKNEEWMVKKCCDGLKQQFSETHYSFETIKDCNGAYGKITGIYIEKLCDYLIGHDAHYKKLHNIFWNAKKECILKLFEGYLDGDGCHFIVKSDITGKDIEIIEATSASKILLLQLRKLLLRFGIVASVNIHNKEGIPVNINNGYNGVSKENYTFIIRGVQAKIFSELLWGSHLSNNESERTAKQSFISNGYLFLRVQNKIEVDGIEEVYGFQIEGDKSFCTAGLATHNTLVPQGEARMPGKGYESINGLHSDQFGRYGAFDRFKVLADVAPTSPEYKLWKRIASQTITDPELKAEMQEIKDRVAQQTKQHDFYNYKYVGRKSESKEAVISEILDRGQFKIIGSDETYKLAGVTVKANPNEKVNEVMQRYIAPGMKVRLVTDSNQYYGRNRDKLNSINAAVISDGENVSQLMLDNGDAKKRKNDNSVAFTHANHGGIVNAINWAAEGLAHANIPIIHNRWMNMNDPLESYKDDYLYGSSFQDWSHPIESFIIPAMRTAASSTFWTGLGVATDIIRNNVETETAGSKELKNFVKDILKGTQWEENKIGHATTNWERSSNSIRKYAKYANTFTDRGSLMGGLVAKTLTLGKSDAQNIKSVGRRLGNAATLIYSAVEAPENLGVQMISWSRLGYLLADTKLGAKGQKNKWAIAGAGAAAGVLRWAGSKKLLSDDETSDTYIPDSARRRWDMEDYFDRLTYIKYNALYRKAATEAKEKEGIDIEALLELQDKEAHQVKQARQEIKDSLAKLEKRNDNESRLMQEKLRERLDSLKQTQSPIMSAGDYTKSAIMYYNAAKATMYALDETSSMTDIIRALPRNERDYYMEFVKEADPDKRKEILKTVSPQLRKALNLVWYSKAEKPISNERYFADHNLPAPSWSGWRPNIDLADVKTKVVKNEGSMLTSDFGIYASEYRKDKVINAPNIEYNNGGDGLFLSALNVASILKGYGLQGVEVNVEPKSDSTLDVIANITRVVPYNIEQGIMNLF